MTGHLSRKLDKDEVNYPGIKYLLPVIRYRPKYSIIIYSIMKVTFKYIADEFTVQLDNNELLTANQLNVLVSIHLGFSN